MWIWLCFFVFCGACQLMETSSINIQHLLLWSTNKKVITWGWVNPLGSEVILGPLRCFDMPWYLCLFQLLITYYWPTCIFFCIQHKLCYNIMWPRWMYMFAFFSKKILCVVSKFCRLEYLLHNYVRIILLTRLQKTIYWFKFFKTCFVIESLYAREWQWPWILSDSRWRTFLFSGVNCSFNY